MMETAGGKTDNREYALFSALIAVAVDGIIVIDERGTVKIYNEACERLFGYRREEVVDHGLDLLIPGARQSEHTGYISRYVATGQKHIIGIGREVLGRRKDGSTFPMYISVGEGRLDSTRIFVGIVHDISERKARERRIEELQRDLRHVTRLSAMGQLASAIAHELNQPLTASLNYANAAQRVLADLDGDAASLARDATEKAGTQIARAGEIIRRLREFVGKREQSRGPIDINHTVGEAIALGLIGAVGAAIPVETEFDPGLPPVLADRVQIQQVLINLMLNAVDAMQGMEQPKLRITTSRQSDGAIRIGVVDNGVGMSDETRRSLFQPFVTTKPNGIGMGLSICRTIVETHGGRLWAETAPERGTIFYFTLPAADDEQSPAV
ncbi:MAG: sensor histidine kinase [Rhizomicrobium sp.]